MLGVGWIVGLLALPPVADGYHYVMTETVSLIRYMMDPAGDLQWPACPIPETLRTCLNPGFSCTPRTQTVSCPNEGEVRVSIHKDSSSDWEMKVHTVREGYVKVKSSPHTNILEMHLKTQGGGPSWTLNLQRSRQEKSLNVRGTVTRQNPAFITRFQDYQIRLISEDPLTISIEGAIRVTTQNPKCTEGTYLVKTLKPLHIRPEDFAILSGALMINGRSFIFQDGKLQGETLSSSCPYSPWSHTP